jgi:BirA family biotin operon repressor/biotin-[acetyl-CoA-carboxylase] ligase
MNHLHFSQIESTQVYLQNNFEELIQKDNEVLVSTNNQTKGKGRLGNKWSQLDNSLAFSFIIKANPEITLSSLEIGVLVAQFMNKNYQLDIKLKWPNDILNAAGEKCGGIICNMKEDNQLIVGVGVNMGEHESATHPEEKTKFPIGYLNAKILLDIDKQKDIPASIYSYILNNRLSPTEAMSKWNTYNYHQNMNVTIRDLSSEVTGKFLGINNIGAAQIEDQSGKVHILVSGSLWNT